MVVASGSTTGVTIVVVVVVVARPSRTVVVVAGLVVVSSTDVVTEPTGIVPNFADAGAAESGSEFASELVSAAFSDPMIGTIAANPAAAAAVTARLAWRAG